MKSTLQIHCECCNAPATATFDGDQFVSAVCTKHGMFLSVPTLQIEGMRAVLRERAKFDPIAGALLKAAVVIRAIAGMGHDSTDKEIADEAIRIARLWGADDSQAEPLRAAHALVNEVDRG